MGRKITIGSAKAAGRDLQQWTCKHIADLLGLQWGANEMIASREGAQSGTDVRLVGEARQRFPFSVECKNTKVWDLQKAVYQARGNCEPDTDWLLVMKRRHKLKDMRIEPIIVMDAGRFFRLLKEAGYASKAVSRQG